MHDRLQYQHIGQLVPYFTVKQVFTKLKRVVRERVQAAHVCASPGALAYHNACQ